MIFVDGRIVVLRNPTPACKKHIVVCCMDGGVMDNPSCEFFDDLTEANLVQQDRCENETKLTDFGRAAVETPREKYPTAKLISLDYPWLENLEAKRCAWLETEIRAITPAA